MANWWDDAPLADAAPASSPYAGAISSIESGGNYKAIGPATRTGDRALGKYQVMSANVGPWSEEILGRRVTPQEFISSPEIQDKIFQGKFGKYAEKYGPEGAARAWFAGEGGMNDPNRKDVLGTTVAGYGAKFSKALGYAPEEKRPTEASAQSKKANWWDDAPLVQDGAAAKPVDTSGLPRVRISKAPDNAYRGADNADRGALDAGARGVAQGLTANFGDEIRGLVEASGANPDDPASLVKLISGALKYWTGDADAKKRYEETVKREREINKAAEEQHPVASTVGNIAGAIALPIGAAGQAATLPGRMAAGAGVGAALGGAAGVGEGVGAVDSASRGLVGAAAGGALGGVAPAAIEGAVRGARAAATPIANAVRGVRNVDDEAARRVVTALERDRGIDPQATQRLTPNEYAASVQSGGPATIMDIGGEQTRALARSAANTSPEGRAVINRTINERFEGQSDRVTGWLRNTFHYPDADSQREAIKKTAQSVNKPAYAKAYDEGDKQVWSNELERLTAAPFIQSALGSAISKWKNYAVRDGYGAANPPFRIENGGLIKQGGGGLKAYPNIQLWDYAARELQDAARAAPPGSQTASLYNDLARQLKTELDKIVPSYKTAREGAAGFFKAENALEAGQNFVTQNFAAGEARRALTKMSAQERQLFQDGFVSRFIETLDSVGDRRSILNKIADSPAAREKLNIALGRPKAEELEAGLRVEGIMDLARNAVQGNSTTARQLAELGLAGGAYGFSGGGINPFTDTGAVVNAALVYGAARGRNVINERLSRRVAEMLVSNDPRIITRGIQTIARNQTLFNSLRSADRGLARVGGEQSGGLPALQAAGVSRAEDQPDVPRPPGQ